MNQKNFLIEKKVTDEANSIFWLRSFPSYRHQAHLLFLLCLATKFSSRVS